ncbi:uncharacterized protein EV422DRAFT_503976 [Fimicolochytrium jonesii]|uniref:uncharacterized protein n=1 Tax=Fimicolochytrium jonesii TaxID=1396493 RepID=UPI0022FE6DFA|nr:uncharacterized protein EV422DRAFT_503976 [Fimicolochytrium jonesii]KAI8825253.1 hypothetical protein EV422DRAFT_503976 [Fimicolochytrium jonesii]
MTPEHATKIWLPNQRQCKILRISGYASQILVMCPLSLACGKAYDEGHIDRYKILTAVVYWVFGFCSVIVGVGFLLFAHQMVRIASETLKESKETGLLRTTQLRRTQADMQKSITKMKAIHLTLGPTLLWYAVVLAIFGFLQDEVFALTWWSKIQAIGSEVLGTVALLCNFCFIAWAESKPAKQVDVTSMGATLASGTGQLETDDIQMNGTDSECPHIAK